MKLIVKIGTAVAGLYCLASCNLIHSNDMDCQHYTPDGIPFAYVGISLSTGKANQVTKADDDHQLPTGGEDGDGKEDGQKEENKVSNVTVFFFESDNGINGDDSTPIVASQYWPSRAFLYTGNTQYTTDPVEVYNLEIGHTYDMLVMANAGYIITEDIKTLGDLRKLCTESIWSYELGWINDQEVYHYTKFMMSSAESGDKLFISANNSATNPATTSYINLERLSARVDYQAKGTDGEEAGVYKVTDKKTGREIGKARISGAMLINTLNGNSGSYWFKRVTKPGESFATGSVEYLGEEQVKADYVATNYVLDPQSREGKYAEDFDSDTYYPNIGYDNLNWANHIVTESLVSGLDDDYKCIGYPKENVNEVGKRSHTTGVVFQACYTPTGYTEGDTFFEWNGSMYPTLEKMMEAFDAVSWNNYINNDAVWKSGLTWNELRTNIIPNIKMDDPTGYRAWLVSESNEKDGVMNGTKSSLRWDSYVKNVLKYNVGADGKSQVDYGTGVEEGTTRRLLHEISGVATYKDGICYYTYWIKHANDQNDSNDLVKGKSEGGGVMEYAIVRNNIYKLRVRSISTPGGDSPGDRFVTVNVLVENWTPEKREEIIIKPQ